MAEHNVAQGPDFVEAGRKLFSGPVDFIWAAAKSDDLPPLGPPEIAFAGRSNVGKSSLINALTGRNTLARTSNTPGRTQQLNFFAMGPNPDDIRLRFVDMPGYGYAAVEKTKVANWNKMLKDYLRGRASLLRVFVLIDGRRGIKDNDVEMLDMLDASAVSYQVILTKRDDIKLADQESMIAATLAALRKRPAAFPEVLFTSSETGAQIPELRASIMKLLVEHGGAQGL